MRINLTTPFAEKDAAKALGARWDSARKIWYIVDPQDLAPFMRWIPDMDVAQEGASSNGDAEKSKPSKARAGPDDKPRVITGPAGDVPHCGCDVLPWADCVHTLEAGEASQRSEVLRKLRMSVGGNALAAIWREHPGQQSARANCGSR